MVDHKIREVES